jgi:ribosomal protein L32
MTVFIFWVLFSVAAGVFASNRGRSGIGWFFLSLLISPLLGLIFVAVMKDLSRPGAASSQPGPGTHVKCPACAEYVLPDAKVCKHCGTALVPVAHYTQDQQHLAKIAQADEQAKYITGVLFIVGLFVIAGVLSNCGG